MILKEAAEIRIRQGIAGIFNSAEYPKFLSFASRFLSYSCRNIIMLYMQAPDAEYVAGYHAWQRIFNETVPPDQIPVLVLYPEYEMRSKSFRYTVRKVFDRPPAGRMNSVSGDLKGQIRKCDSPDLFECLRGYIRNETGKYAMLSVGETSDEIDENGNAVMVPARLSDREQFRLLFEYYTSSIINEEDSPVLSAYVMNSLRYIVFSYYRTDGLDRIVFPFAALSGTDEAMQAEILRRTISEAKRITNYMDAKHHGKVREMENES